MNGKNGKNYLSMVEHIKRPHCFKPLGFERNISYLLYHFSVESECGYRKATHLGIVNDLEEVFCSLRQIKSCTSKACLHHKTQINSCFLVSRNLKGVERRIGHKFALKFLD